MAAARNRKGPPKRSRTSSSDSDILFKACKVALLLVSLVSLVFGCFYAYPFFVNAYTQTFPKLWTVLRGWLTPSVMFLLMILLVGTLAVSNGMQKLSKRGMQELSKRGRLWNLKEDENEEQEAPEPPVEQERPHVSKNQDPSAEPDVRHSRPTVDSKTSVSGRPRAKRSPDLPRIARSKSEQVTSLMKTELPDHHLRKAGTFESTFQKDSGKARVVVVDDPPEAEATAASNEVDQQADDFISKFYQNMKLQRLESFMRYKNRIDRSQG